MKGKFKNHKLSTGLRLMVIAIFLVTTVGSAVAQKKSEKKNRKTQCPCDLG